jgi:hypothetical protein
MHPAHQIFEQALGVGKVLRVWKVEAELLEHVLEVGLQRRAHVVVKQAATHIPLLPLGIEQRKPRKGRTRGVREKFPQVTGAQ